MFFIARSVSGFNRCLCANSLKESDSTVTVVAERSIHFTVQYNNYPVLHIIEYKFFKIILLILFRLYHQVQSVLPHVQVEVKR